jgi:hypothetical protein
MTFCLTQSTALLRKPNFKRTIKACQHELSGGRPRGASDIELCFFEAYSIVNGVASVPGDNLHNCLLTPTVKVLSFVQECFSLERRNRPYGIYDAEPSANSTACVTLMLLPFSSAARAELARSQSRLT